MPDPCPTCGHVPQPRPADWLSPDEVALVGFMVARLGEHRDACEPLTGPDSALRMTAIAASDLAGSASAVVEGFAWTVAPERRALLRFPILLLSQPWLEHPDYNPAWRDELATKLG